jgi:nucleolar protein 14
LDRRFGENDPTMAPEDKMLERFTQEKQRRHKNSSAFDLEEEDDQGGLTHMGQSLSLDGPALEDDFDEEGLELSDAEDHPSDNDNPRKRRRDSQSEVSENEEDVSEVAQERKKTKQEVMKEVMAKSKLYKYERQAMKEDDDDLREELDKDMAEIQALLRGSAPRPVPVPVATLNTNMNSDRAALLTGTDKVKFDKEYDLRLRQLAQDQKAKPTERSKTEEQKLAEDSRRLQLLEAQRLRRMQGIPDEADEESNKNEQDADFEDRGDEEEEEEDFGLGRGLKERPIPQELGAEDEDDFIIDDDLVASGSDIDVSDEDSEIGGSDRDSDDDDFLDGLLTEEEARRPEFLTGANAPLQDIEVPAFNGVNGDLAYTFSCPQTHEELLNITNELVAQDIPTVIQRIRALYHPKLKSENKSKLGNFTVALIDHISYLANQSPTPPFNIIETIIRHIHSLSKTYPVETANAFRNHLESFHTSRPMAPTPGDLIILTAIGSIFPTSDHFHQVVTPAMLSMARYIGLNVPQNLSEYATGTYIVTLCLQYQQLSKRYIPELIGFILNSLYAFAPANPRKISGSFPYHETKLDRVVDAHHVQTRTLRLGDISSHDLSEMDENLLKMSLLETNLRLLETAADSWTGKSAFQEVFGPASKLLEHLGNRGCRGKIPETVQRLVDELSTKLGLLLKNAELDRRPLELHHHKPLAIKMSIPKFEESFNPDKHYDPDRERADASKLRAEHKRERKGALRELRKDGNFIARESLREKKERDAAYEKKHKRLIAEIQGEEGREAKIYEREKAWRKGKKS